RANVRYALAAGRAGEGTTALTEQVFRCETDTLLHPARASVTVLLSGRFALDETSLGALLRRNPHETEVKTLLALLSGPSVSNPSSKEDDEKNEENDEGVALCKVALSTTEMKQHFTGEINDITPTFAVQVGTSKIFGTWVDVDDPEVPLSNIFFFARRCDIKQAEGKCKLFSVVEAQPNSAMNPFAELLFGQIGSPRLSSAFAEHASIRRTVEVLGVPSESDVAALRRHYNLDDALSCLTSTMKKCKSKSFASSQDNCRAGGAAFPSMIFTFTIVEETTNSLKLRYHAQPSQSHSFRLDAVVSVSCLSCNRLRVTARIRPQHAVGVCEAVDINHDLQFACPVSARGWSWSAKHG
ncbi:unnamed protein product, partial [Amoebophrya sp. A25]